MSVWVCVLRLLRPLQLIGPCESRVQPHADTQQATPVQIHTGRGPPSHLLGGVLLSQPTARELIQVLPAVVFHQLCVKPADARHSLTASLQRRATVYFTIQIQLNVTSHCGSEISGSGSWAKLKRSAADIKLCKRKTTT